MNRTNWHRWILLFLFAGLTGQCAEQVAVPSAPSLPLAAPAAAAPTVAEVLDIAPVWAGHPVDFALLTDPERALQYVAYYDKDRRMTVASRRLDSKQWTYMPVPERKGGTSATTGWDSHNYIAIALDSAGQLHLAGNMHCHPLLYARTTVPGDIATLKRIDRMLPDREARVTYPRFLRGPKDELIFAYRDGQSGKGADLYNLYDPATQAWRRLFDQPLFDGQGKMSAYSMGPVQDATGIYHLTWVWRDSPDAGTNHDVSYARSRDLVHWEDSSGKPMTLPITLANGEIVDPVPARGGAINGNTKIGFDAENRVVVSYIKYDAAGKTQAYVARRAPAGWTIVQVSDWDYRWEINGGGSLSFEVGVGGIRLLPNGNLGFSCSHPKAGSKTFQLDPKTLRPVGFYSPPPATPAGLRRLESAFPGMRVRWDDDTGKSPEKNVRYLLRWEALPPNRDKPREGEIPPPSMLRVYKLSSQEPVVRSQ